jgi:hypothetical protein
MIDVEGFNIKLNHTYDYQQTFKRVSVTTSRTFHHKYCRFNVAKKDQFLTKSYLISAILTTETISAGENMSTQSSAHFTYDLRCSIGI